MGLPIGENLALTLAPPPVDQGTYQVLRDPLGSELRVDRPVVLLASRADTPGGPVVHDRPQDVARFERQR